MKILVSGGGTGGHITPILAVAHELKKQLPQSQIIYVGERRSKFSDLTKDNAAIDEIHTIFSGKLRRYHGASLFSKLLDVQTLFRNVRDLVYVIVGTAQAWRLLGKLKPDIVFLKGGYVGLPVGLAAAMRRIPFVTHDSDALPGLSNRLVSRWATVHTTGLPTEFYSYPKQKTRYVGVLVVENFRLVDQALQDQYRQELDIPLNAKMLLITGGSLGAQRLNEAVVTITPTLLAKYSDVYIIHQVGKGNLDIYKDHSHGDRLQVKDFIPDMYHYMGAADVVVTRAGATNLAELGVQGKACVVVANPQLAGGHQTENANYLRDHRAVLVVDETSFSDHPNQLQKAIEQLLDYPEMRQELGQTFRSLTKTGAAHELATLLLQTAKHPKALNVEL